MINQIVLPAIFFLGQTGFFPFVQVGLPELAEFFQFFLS
jgi:hypothetical protein